MKKFLAALALCAITALAAAPVNATIWNWSQTAASNGNSDAVINFQEGQAPSTVNDSARAMMSVVAKWRDDASGTLLATGGTANAQTVTSNGSAAALTNGWTICAKIGAGLTNTGAATLNVDTLGAKDVQLVSGSALTGGEMAAGTIQCFVYQSSNTVWLLREEVPIGGGLEFNTSTGAVQRSALTGDVSASAASNTTTIGASKVVTSMIGNAQVTQAKLAAAVYAMPVGMVFDYSGTACPSLSVEPYGQAIDRTTYAALFAVTSTVYGAGNGTTTFNVPDLRGRVAAGEDDMGGVSANRLTAITGSLDGDVLGATGGEEGHTVSIAQLPAHDHGAGTYAAGAHTHAAGTYAVGAHTHDPGTMAVASHTHSAGTLSVQAAQEGTAVNATGGSGKFYASGSSQSVTGNTGATAPALSGSTTSVAPSFSGSSGSTAPSFSGTSGSTGSGTAMNVVQPTLVLHKCIFTGV